MTWNLIYLLVAVAAVIAGTFYTWLFRRLSWTFNFLDVPKSEEHKQHHQATPLLGGAGIVSAWLTVIIAGAVGHSLLSAQLPPDLSWSGMRERLPLLGVIAGGGVAICIMGMVDDKRALGWKLKLTLQAIICGIVCADPKIRVSLFQQNPYLMWFISLMLFLFIVNAFNFFDNMDGLAAGVAFIASAIFAIISAIRGNHFVTVLGIATAGVSLGYYFFNCYPASIFMGDAGSHFLGYMLAIQGSLTTFWKEGTPSKTAVLIPVFVLALPIFDTFAVMFIRFKEKRPLFQGDHCHVSHRFYRMGVSKKTAVLLVHLLSLTLSLGALTLLFLRPVGVVFIFLQAAAVLTMISILHKKKDDEDQE
jgi:UDP-GlcNAc:undecaprenyl-phosphate GlcNAc-1-phosphate transferase